MDTSTRLEKSSAFSYFVNCIIEWYKEKKEVDDNDLSKLKLNKLLFFVCANSFNDSDSLFGIFDNFYAAPYGPIEIDIYDCIDNSNIPSLSIDTRKTTVLGDCPIITNNVKCKIDDAISRLKAINYEIVFMRAFDLVEISHRWISWQIAFEEAKNKNILKEKMDVNLIRKDRNLFHLRPF